MYLLSTICEIYPSIKEEERLPLNHLQNEDLFDMALAALRSIVLLDLHFTAFSLAGLQHLWVADEWSIY